MFCLPGAAHAVAPPAGHLAALFPGSRPKRFADRGGPAAQWLNVTVSAVSRQVASLEALLGVPLFDRRPRGMVRSGRTKFCVGGRHPIEAAVRPVRQSLSCSPNFSGVQTLLSQVVNAD
ncbi:LysR family transcriptional regulator [Cupriavidus gilardii]|nr:LysR family transcriptional regulator [Cupriavidus gilardii]